jgi:PST family polysaccharide transporter
VNFDKLVVGRVWGADVLGHYSVASQLVTTPVSHLNTALGGVTFSALSRLQNDAVRFRNYFLKGYALNVSLTLPITIFSAVFAQDIVLVALGQKWAEAAIIFQMLAPAALFYGLVNPLVWVLFASHRHVRSLKIALVIAVLVPAGCLIGLPYGAKGVAAGYSAAMVLWLVPHVIWCLRGTPITLLDLLRTSGPSLISSLVAVVLAWTVCAYFGPLQTHFSELAVAGCVTMAAYASLMILVMGKDFYLDLVRAMRNRSFSPSKKGETEGWAVSH